MIAEIIAGGLAQVPPFTVSEWLLTALLFIWTGFVRSGLGFGGAALGLPLMLFLHPDPLFWLPMIGIHLLFFSALTLRSSLHAVDWRYLGVAARWIIPAALLGVMGLITLPTEWLIAFIYTITLIYALLWLFNRAIISRHPAFDRLLLLLGGYVAGTALTGAPLIVAVFMQNVAKEQLRNTLFVLWFILVSMKMATFVTLQVELHLVTALLLLPIAAIGHGIGLRWHERLVQNDRLFKRWIGGLLIGVSLLGLLQLVWP